MNKIIIGSLAALSASAASIPTALFHGMGDACSNRGFENFTKEIAEQTGSYAECIEIGNGGSTSLFENFEKQAEAACESIKANPNFQGEFNVAGLSQGALIARYIVEECDTASVPKKLLSIGGPNMGVQAVPHCQSGIMCKWINYVAQHATDLQLIQNIVGPAGYYRDPKHLDSYLKDSCFLPYINNEETEKSDLYKQRFSSLDGLMLVAFT